VAVARRRTLQDSPRRPRVGKRLGAESAIAKKKSDRLWAEEFSTSEHEYIARIEIQRWNQTVEKWTIWNRDQVIAQRHYMADNQLVQTATSIQMMIKMYLYYRDCWATDWLLCFVLRDNFCGNKYWIICKSKKRCVFSLTAKQPIQHSRRYDLNLWSKNLAIFEPNCVLGHWSSEWLT
jgi:hypothetical protein